VTVYCATTNAGKLREFGLIAAHYGAGRLQVEPVPGLREVAAPEETGATFAENAGLKAAFYSGLVDGVVFADDSGLAVDALGGAPGIYSARYAGEGATDAANNAKVLAELAGTGNRTARFVCAMAVARGGEVLGVFEDDVAGELLNEARGPNGFGYDPLFYYPPFGCTFGEAAAERKLLVSHRGKAMAKMIEWLLRDPQFRAG
jgi:XTP/dITP diphosphohydrolase